MYSNLKYIIVGLPYSGIYHLTKMFNKSQIETSHEKLFEHEEHFSTKRAKRNGRDQYYKKEIQPLDKILQQGVRVEWYNNTSFVSEGSWSASPYIGTRYIPEDVKVIHTIRDPFDNIRSLYSNGFFDVDRKEYSYSAFIRKKLYYEQYDETYDIDHYVNFYIIWNSLIQAKLKETNNEVFTLRIENLEGELDDLSRFVGEPLNGNLDKVIELEKPKRFTKKYPDYSYWDVFEMVKNGKFSHHFDVLMSYRKSLGYR